MTVDFNNIRLQHRDHLISVAQHLVDGNIDVSEILVWGPYVDDEIIRFGVSITSLAEALIAAKALIDTAIEQGGS